MDKMVVLLATPTHGGDGVEMMFGPVGNGDEAEGIARALEEGGYHVETFVLNSPHHVITTLGLAIRY